MILVVEFPMMIIEKYNGVSNLDITLDDNITYYIGKYFYDRNIYFKILQLDFIASKPNINEELIRYTLEINIMNFNHNWVLSELKNAGFEKGLTIKSEKNEIIYADEFSADIQEKRRIKNIS